MSTGIHLPTPNAETTAAAQLEEGSSRNDALFRGPEGRSVFSLEPNYSNKKVDTYCYVS
jgi:hypothetical protein